MAQINLHDAKTHLSELVERARSGEEIVIARAGTPVARLVAYAVEGPRILGRFEGQIRIADDFDTLPPEVERAFRGELP